MLPNADRLNLRDIEWILITPENFEEKITELRTSGRPIVLFALTDAGYENLALNFSDIRAYIQQQNAIIVAYDNYYKDANKALDDANTEIENTNREIESQQNQEQPKPAWKIW